MKFEPKTESADTNIQEEKLTDLPVADEEADQTKGGEGKATAKLFVFCASGQY